MYNQFELKTLADKVCMKVTKIEEGKGYFSYPFKHIVVDDFLTTKLADVCLTNFPKLEDDCWEHVNDEEIEVKSRTTWTSEFDIPDGIINAVRIMNSAVFLKEISEKLNIPQLLPDPYFTGGGLNVTRQSGLLDVHIDGNYHDASGLNRRVNAILYLNPGWSDSWGGELGLFDASGQTCLKKIAPIHNRLFIFETHDKSFHGLPDPVNFPEKSPRRSIILYYYTKENRPKEFVTVEQPHSAMWRKKKFLDKRGNKTRDFE